jgi:hypothetical protein
MKNSTYVYNHWAPNLHVAHLHLCVNYEWIKIQQRMNLNLTLNELRFN